jgi:hypothetical protein
MLRLVRSDTLSSPYLQYPIPRRESASRYIEKATPTITEEVVLRLIIKPEARSGAGE